MTVTKSRPQHEKIGVAYLALGKAWIESGRKLGSPESLRWKKAALDLERLLNENLTPRLPYQVWRGLNGLPVQQQFFNAWAYEIGQAGSYALAMVEGMTGGKHETD